LAQLFPNIPFSYITNGVHPPTWVTPRMAVLYDKRIGPEWRTNPESFVKARMISPSELWSAHHQNKVESLEQLSAMTGATLDPDVFTIVFARRAAAYKRWDLIFNDGFVDYLERELPGRMQVIFAGKPHPKDENGRKMMEHALAAGARLKNHKVVQLPDYGIDYSKLLLMAADAWLNNPQSGKEACATSGMKAALNGIPHISNPEGWWWEAPRMQGVNGWTFQGNGTSEANAALSAIKHAMISYYSGTMAAMMPQIISDFGPLFHSTRMLRQYQARAWNGH
ncbi:MAG TPA: glycogen/starch/alpha-glucan phosphorylase, partial [Candidatus Nanoarchaeia archaeon]|nr:glycogen/starch/alpha-glucan phosphorylase [Candidatus Nanoarchaeia archaeon]